MNESKPTCGWNESKPTCGWNDFCHDGDIDEAADRLEELLSALK
jgi:hypothetical protein